MGHSSHILHYYYDSGQTTQYTLCDALYYRARCGCVECVCNCVNWRLLMQQARQATIGTREEEPGCKKVTKSHIQLGRDSDCCL